MIGWISREIKLRRRPILRDISSLIVEVLRKEGISINKKTAFILSEEADLGATRASMAAVPEAPKRETAHAAWDIQKREKIYADAISGSVRNFSEYVVKFYSSKDKKNQKELKEKDPLMFKLVKKGTRKSKK